MGQFPSKCCKLDIRNTVDERNFAQPEVCIKQALQFREKVEVSSAQLLKSIGISFQQQFHLVYSYINVIVIRLMDWIKQVLVLLKLKHCFIHSVICLFISSCSATTRHCWTASKARILGHFGVWLGIAPKSDQHASRSLGIDQVPAHEVRLYQLLQGGSYDWCWLQLGSRLAACYLFRCFGFSQSKHASRWCPAHRYLKENSCRK